MDKTQTIQQIMNRVESNTNPLAMFIPLNTQIKIASEIYNDLQIGNVKNKEGT